MIRGFVVSCHITRWKTVSMVKRTISCRNDICMEHSSPASSYPLRYERLHAITRFVNGYRNAKRCILKSYLSRERVGDSNWEREYKHIRPVKRHTHTETFVSPPCPDTFVLPEREVQTRQDKEQSQTTPRVSVRRSYVLILSFLFAIPNKLHATGFVSRFRIN